MTYVYRVDHRSPTANHYYVKGPLLPGINIATKELEVFYRGRLSARIVSVNTLNQRENTIIFTLTFHDDGTCTILDVGINKVIDPKDMFAS
jgi:hypothetical protein